MAIDEVNGPHRSYGINKPESEADKIIAALKKLPTNKRVAARKLFSELYPVIMQRIAEGVSQKNIIAALAEHKLQLSPATFKKFFHAETIARADLTKADPVK